MKRLAILLLASPAFAHPGHDATVTEYVATPFAGADHMLATMLVIAGTAWLVRRFRAKAQKA
ncbi:MAG: hydrogenase/urease accessory protein HupE [Rhodothermales bacterium]|jgi:hydrogenase/urease accessory protein HupE